VIFILLVPFAILEIVAGSWLSRYQTVLHTAEDSSLVLCGQAEPLPPAFGSPQIL